MPVLAPQSRRQVSLRERGKFDREILVVVGIRARERKDVQLNPMPLRERFAEARRMSFSSPEKHMRARC